MGYNAAITRSPQRKRRARRKPTVSRSLKTNGPKNVSNVAFCTSLCFYLMNNSNIEQGIDYIRNIAQLMKKIVLKICQFLELIFPLMCIWTFPPKV